MSENHDNDAGFEILWCEEPKDKDYPEPPASYKLFICVETLPWGKWKCWSPHCPVHSHRSKDGHAYKAKGSRPKDKGMKRWAITLPVGAYLPAKVLSRVRQDFNRRLRRIIGKLEYWYVLHHEESERYNLHLLALTDKDGIEADVKEQWKIAMQRQAKRNNLGGTFYVRECYSWDGYIDYLLQRNEDDEPLSKMPPRHLYRRYTGRTKGFTQP